MPLQRLEHYLVLSDDIHGTRDFYRDVPCIHIAEWRNSQMFLRDPNGVPLEINFRI